jgi:hypothetical protein
VQNHTLIMFAVYAVALSLVNATLALALTAIMVALLLYGVAAAVWRRRGSR